MKQPAAAQAISVTPAGPRDYATLTDLHDLCLDPSWGRESMVGIFAAPGALGLIARLEGGAVGFALCRRAVEECELLALGVLPARRRRGVARALIDATIAALAKDGVRALFLEVAEDNSAGRALYTAVGFSAVGRRAGYYQRVCGAPVAALVLRKQITLFEDA